MTVLAISGFLAQGSSGAPAGQAPAWMTFVPLVLIMVIFYIILIRPQQKKAKDHAALLKTLRPGDKVVTSGGILGVVISVKEKSISLRSADTKLEILKTAVSEITERTSAASQS
jgi:preprotein translocase subunit YajC